MKYLLLEMLAGLSRQKGAEAAPAVAEGGHEVSVAKSCLVQLPKLKCGGVRPDFLKTKGERDVRTHPGLS